MQVPQENEAGVGKSPTIPWNGLEFPWLPGLPPTLKCGFPKILHPPGLAGNRENGNNPESHPSMEIPGASTPILDSGPFLCLELHFEPPELQIFAPKNGIFTSRAAFLTSGTEFPPLTSRTEFPNIYNGIFLSRTAFSHLELHYFTSRIAFFNL